MQPICVFSRFSPCLTPLKLCLRISVENFLCLGAIINGAPLSWLIDANVVFCQSHLFHPTKTIFGVPSPLTMFSSRSALRDGPLFRLVVWEHRSTARLYASTIVAVSLSLSLLFTPFGLPFSQRPHHPPLPSGVSVVAVKGRRGDWLSIKKCLPFKTA